MTSGKITSFRNMIDIIHDENRPCEILVPMADSSSALKGVASFLKTAKIKVKVRLFGISTNILDLVEKHGLFEDLERRDVELTPVDSMEEAFHKTLLSLEHERHQIILKGNSTSDQLLRGLLQDKDKILGKGAIITHMRVFESPGGMCLMGDGGINVISNIPDPAKREKIISCVRENSVSVMQIFGNDNPDIYRPNEADSIAELEKDFHERYAETGKFPDVLEFPWIGPANIVYKAVAGTPWQLTFGGDTEVEGAGRISRFLREDGKPLFLITPEKGPTFQDKMTLIQSCLALCREEGIAKPKTALLDFTEQYTTFMNTPSIRESREIVESFNGSDSIIIDGPMAYDLAVSEKAAKTKSFHSPVAGDPDILVAPEFASGVLLKAVYEKWNDFRMPWPAADISFGGSVPILVPSRSDTPEHKLRSIVTAAYVSLHSNYSLPSLQ